MSARRVDWLPRALTRVGPEWPVVEVLTVRRSPDAFPLFVCAARLPDEAEDALAESAHRLPAFGASVNRSQAVAAALAEPGLFTNPYWQRSRSGRGDQEGAYGVSEGDGAVRGQTTPFPPSAGRSW